jgi:hydrogenase nickel incorporation protein HypA/HybF
MHEYSICESLIGIIISELDKYDSHSSLVKSIVVVGELRQVIPEYMETAYQLLTKGTRAEASRLVIKQVRAKLKCNNCGWEGENKNIDFCCPKCGSNNIDLTGGNQLYLESLEVETNKE